MFTRFQILSPLHHRQQPTGLHLIGLVLALAWSGCMLNPVDGQVVTTTTEEIGFAGFTRVENQPVELQFGLGSSWTPVAHATSSGTRSIATSDGIDLFSWSIPGALPDAAWTNGVTGRFAKTRMRYPEAEPAEPMFLCTPFSPTDPRAWPRIRGSGAFCQAARVPAVRWPTCSHATIH